MYLALAIKTLGDLDDKQVVSQPCRRNYPGSSPDFYKNSELGGNGMQPILLTDLPNLGTEDDSYDDFCIRATNQVVMKNSAWCRAVGICTTDTYQYKHLAEKAVLSPGPRRLLDGYFPRFGDDRSAPGRTPGYWNCI